MRKWWENDGKMMEKWWKMMGKWWKKMEKWWENDKKIITRTFPDISPNENFPEKSGSVTFLPLWSPNFMQKIRNILRAWEKCVTDGQTAGSNFSAPHETRMFLKERQWCKLAESDRTWEWEIFAKKVDQNLHYLKCPILRTVTSHCVNFSTVTENCKKDVLIIFEIFEWDR